MVSSRYFLQRRKSGRKILRAPRKLQFIKVSRYRIIIISSRIISSDRGESIKSKSRASQVLDGVLTTHNDDDLFLLHIPRITIAHFLSNRHFLNSLKVTAALHNKLMLQLKLFLQILRGRYIVIEQFIPLRFLQEFKKMRSYFAMPQNVPNSNCQFLWTHFIFQDRFFTLLS